MADAKTTLNALAERYCEGWCKGNGGRGSFKDCTGCDIAAATPQPAASDVPHDVVRALEEAEQAISEYYRYWTGGETRGSYDGKPERAGLWKAMYGARAALVTTAPSTSTEEALRAENARLRAALEPFAYRVPKSAINNSALNADYLVATAGIEIKYFRTALSALSR
ncbi:hypothetical protein [Aurantimonas sp. NFXS3]|uniref:hypothetical protein n=1 Tax=Aurantimonas sp. NFXS3 TaxID=2818434 RepID=UPI003B8C3BA2